MLPRHANKAHMSWIKRSFKGLIWSGLCVTASECTLGRGEVVVMNMLAKSLTCLYNIRILAYRCGVAMARKVWLVMHNWTRASFVSNGIPLDKGCLVGMSWENITRYISGGNRPNPISNNGGRL